MVPDKKYAIPICDFRSQNISIPSFIEIGSVNYKIDKHRNFRVFNINLIVKRFKYILIQAKWIATPI